MNRFKIIFLSIAFGVAAQAAEIGIPIQLKLKSPGGVYPTESGVNFKLYVLSPTTGCILREEDFASQNVVDGAITLALGSGALGSNDPALSLVQVYDNTTAKTGLSCVDANNNVVSTGQTYTPGAADKRVIRVSTVLLSDPVIVNFNMRSVPYAVQADAVGGKAASEILVRNTGSQLNQTNLNNLLLDATRLNNLLNFASSGSVSSAGNFSGVLAGDVSGIQGSTTVDKIKGIPVSATAPTPGQVLVYNGTQYIPSTVSSTVTSVAGKTGAVTLTSSDISGLGSGAGLNAGSSAGDLVQLDGAGKIPAAYLPGVSGTIMSGDVSGTTSASQVVAVGGKTAAEVAAAVTEAQGATSSNTADTIVKRDSSGNFSSNVISASSNSAFNLYLFDGANSVRVRAPSGLSSNLNLFLPGSDGSNGQFLQTDGAGNLSWASVSAAGGTVTSVTASSPLSSSGGPTPNITLTQASAGSAGYLSSSDWSTFNGKQAALGFTPLDVTAYNADVAGAATCTATQAPYWDTLSDSWGCLNISFPADAVTSVAGRTGAVVLTSSDISGLGSAAVLNAGVSASNVVQLDGSGKLPVSTLPSSVVQSGTLLAGDVSGTISTTSVISVGGKTSSQISTSVNDTAAAGSANTANTIVKRDAAGSFVASAVSATSVGAGNIYLTNGANSVRLKASASLSSDLTLNLPTNNGSAGQVLLTDGAGNLSWANVSAAGGSVSNVTASAPLSSSGGATPNISMTQASAGSAGYLSSTDWSTFNGKQAALGFTPLDVTAYNADVAPAASCTNVQTTYWNTVSDTWACQAISFPVTSVAGRTGAITLASSDISGLGTAASLNVGTSANNVVQLDGTARIPASTLPTTAVTTSTALSGDVTGTVSTVSVDRIKGTSVNGTAPVTGQALIYDGSQWVPAYGVSSYSRVTSDQSRTGNSVVNANNMNFSVVSGNVYKYKFQILYTSSSTTVGLKLGLTYPAVTTASALANIAAGTDGTGAYYQGVLGASGDVVTASSTAAASPAVMFATVEGILVPTANGTLQLTFSAETGGGTVVIKAGSFVEYTIVP